MKKLCVLVFMLMPGLAWAECFVDYKAKKDDPLKLHYGVMAVACEGDVEADVASRLETAGWTLLSIPSRFDEAELETRREDAGAFFLRF